MRIIIIVVFFFVTGFSSYCQQTFTISGDIKEFPGGKVILASYYGEYIRPIDSLVVEKGGKITFNLMPAAYSGYYRIILSKDHNIDLIFNHENIEYIANFNNLLDSLKIISSVENHIYYDFLSFMRDNQLKIDLLSTVVEFYPKEDIFYNELCSQFLKNQRKRSAFIDSISQKYPTSYATRVIKTQNRPFIECNLTEKDKIEYLKSHFWDNIDLTDTLLLRSNVIPNLCIEYLSLFGNSQFNQDQLEDAFIQAVDRIMSASMKNETAYNFILEYLLKGFEKYHFEKVINHMSTKYLPEEKCENESLNSELLRRLENYQKLAIGKPAPAISLKDINDKSIDLSKINTSYVLILFWASWCPHCSTLLPKIKELYDKKTYDLEIIAISVDKDEKAYKSALDNGHYSWINGSELKGWDGKTAVDYNVYATPTMFLLDRNKVIISKPITYQELMSVLSGQ
jgi:thiol-disulfide isomerase/thioredoxin